jgi:hypothetical protein
MRPRIRQVYHLRRGRPFNSLSKALDDAVERIKAKGGRGARALPIAAKRTHGAKS